MDDTENNAPPPPPLVFPPSNPFQRGWSQTDTVGIEHQSKSHIIMSSESASPVIRVSRERVRQKEWYPMPWDDTRRTPQTETVAKDYEMQLKRDQSRLSARQKRYREYQIYYYGTDTERELHKLV